jgi:hypothetical protein
MCILCKNKKDIPFIEPISVIDQELDRDLGLSNVYNISNDLGVCAEPFHMPLFTMSGTEKPFSGTTSGCSGYFTGATSAHTCDAVYNLSELDEFDITFSITGGTDYTGYTGYFCYVTIARSTSPSITEKNYITKDDSILTRCFQYSGITGNTIVDTITKTDLPFRDDEYMIRPYNFYTNQECAVGSIVDTFLLETQSAVFNYETDWYYTTVTNPPKPTLAFSNTDDVARNNVVLQTERIEINDGMTTVFTSIGRALNNKYIVMVNGVTLTEGYDYTVEGRIITFISGSLEPDRDTLQIAYLSVNSETLDIVNDVETYLKTDSFIMTGSTSGVTESNDTNFVNYNPIRDRYEIFLENIADEQSDMFLVINGVTLTNKADYFLSTSDPQKIILDPNTVVNNGDHISIFYFTQNVFFRGDLGYLRTETPVLNWYIEEDVNILTANGKFLVQVTTKDDKNFQTPLQSIYTDYTFGETLYSQQLNPLGTVIDEYIYRIIFFKDYIAVFDNKITTRTISDNGSFKLNLEYIKNTY